MNASITRTLLTVGLASTLSLSMAQKINSKNPLLQQSTLPFGAPDFNRISENDYLPALQAAIANSRVNIKKIVSNKAKPTFANTIKAYENSGKLLDRVSSIFFCLTGSDKTPKIAETQKAIMPELVKFENEVAFNDKLFERVKYVYDHEYKTLTGEDKRLLEETYKGFVRGGALLPKEKKIRLEQINNRISDLQQQWGNMLPDATNDAVVWVNSVDELNGLSQQDIAQCKKDAESRGGKAPYAIVIVNTTQQPILASLDNRDLRKKVYEASINRANGTNKHNTLGVAAEIAKLRAEIAEIMGYKNYAEFSLEKTMAKNPENVYSFLKNLIKVYKPVADKETAEIQAYAQRTQGADFRLQPYDRFYYSAKMKQEQLNVNDDEVKQYFNIDSVMKNGVFYAAEKVYGLTFKQRKDIPGYHKDMKTYEVVNAQGKTIALWYCDYFRRPTKRGGAWMSSFAKQSKEWNQIPIIYNVCNFAKAPEGQPSYVTWDEATTMFHEFGHALHGMLSNCQYNSLSGTAVPRDFVELPSQFNESFASIDDIFDNYAKNALGDKMPADLKAKMLKSINFQPCYALGENLAATCVDLAWHMLSSKDVPTAAEAEQFEKKALAEVGLLDTQIPPRYSTSYFNHVFGGGYAAGYYSYLWTEVLADNVAEAFQRKGALNRSTGEELKEKILSRGFTIDLMKAFSNFTGLDAPDTESLLKARGL
ncbi:MAG: M3 family metallopeptidase [Prevotella sp.]|nr:M3 family metallopeptidase [Prevotella sp.]